jgi:hypothetical protein
VRLRLEQLMQDRTEVLVLLLEELLPVAEEASVDIVKEEAISTVTIEVAFTNITPMVAVHKVIAAE